MNPSTPFSHAFRRAVGLFPKPSVTLAGGAGVWRADGFCAVSFEPAIVALTFSGAVPDRPGESLTVAANGVTLRGSLMESRSIGDHTMLLVTVDGATFGVDPPSISWCRASFGLRLSYPFLESPAALEKFVDDWRTGILPKTAWTHAAH